MLISSSAACSVKWRSEIRTGHHDGAARSPSGDPSQLPPQHRALGSPMSFAPSERIPTLDGWRGIAILLVLAEHAAASSRWSGAWWAHLGSTGVDIFFVLSGYLITMRLLQECDASGRIYLNNFYRRRAFRVLPLVLIYLAAICILRTITGIRPVEVIASLLFFRNYQFAAHPAGIFTAHFWSLSIEEHFYLLWPALLRILGRPRALYAACAIAAASIIWRRANYLYPHIWLPSANAGLSAIRTDARLDGEEKLPGRGCTAWDCSTLFMHTMGTRLPFSPCLRDDRPADRWFHRDR
jgi:hypothetical protein